VRASWCQSADVGAFPDDASASDDLGDTGTPGES
jgi:hypothetical protein